MTRHHLLAVTAAALFALAAGCAKSGGSDFGNVPPTIALDLISGTIGGSAEPITYTVSDPEGDACSISVAYSTDGGLTFTAASSGAGGDGTTVLTSSSGGVAHVFSWDVVADLGTAAPSDAKLRVSVSDANPGNTVISNAFAVTYIPPAGGDTTLPTGTLLEAPSLLVGSHGITLMWDPGTDNVTSQSNLVYRLYMSTANFGITSSATLYQTLSANDRVLTIEGLSTSTAYYFAAVAVDEANNEEAVSGVNKVSRTTVISNTWTEFDAPSAPDLRARHATVYTGDTGDPETAHRLIVWGGVTKASPSAPVADGKAFNFRTETWSSISSTGAPSARAGIHSCWTGTEMLVWGGGVTTNTGGLYNPKTNTWRATSTVGLPASALYLEAWNTTHQSEWCGDRFVVWGPIAFDGSTSGGAMYDPASDTWTTISTTNAPSSRFGPSLAWNGSKVMVWGGLTSGSVPVSEAKLFDPATNVWTTVASSAVAHHEAFLMGYPGGFLAWGGYIPASGLTDTGEHYSITTDTWTADPTLGRPPARRSYGVMRPVRTGAKIFLWGASTGGDATFSGGLLDGSVPGWVLPRPVNNLDLSRSGHSQHATGTNYLVWGGMDGSGGFMDWVTDKVYIFRD